MALKINKLSEKPEKEYAKMAKNVLLGSSKPSVFTQLLLLIALICFGYYFVWNALRVTVLSNIDSVDDPQLFKQKIQYLGSQYGIEDGLKTFKNFGLLMMLAWAIVGAGMAAIYRRKLFGYYLLACGLLTALIVPFISLTWKYVTAEVDWWDFVIPPALIVVFFLSFKRLRKLKEKAKLEGLK